MRTTPFSAAPRSRSALFPGDAYTVSDGPLTGGNDTSPRTGRALRGRRLLVSFRPGERGRRHHAPRRACRRCASVDVHRRHGRRSPVVVRHRRGRRRYDRRARRPRHPFRLGRRGRHRRIRWTAATMPSPPPTRSESTASSATSSETVTSGSGGNDDITSSSSCTIGIRRLQQRGRVGIRRQRRDRARQFHGAQPCRRRYASSGRRRPDGGERHDRCEPIVPPHDLSGTSSLVRNRVA